MSRHLRMKICCYLKPTTRSMTRRVIPPGFDLRASRTPDPWPSRPSHRVSLLGNVFVHIWMFLWLRDTLHTKHLIPLTIVDHSVYNAVRSGVLWWPKIIQNSIHQVSHTDFQTYPGPNFPRSYVGSLSCMLLDTATSTLYEHCWCPKDLLTDHHKYQDDKQPCSIHG